MAAPLMLIRDYHMDTSSLITQSDGTHTPTHTHSRSVTQVPPSPWAPLLKVLLAPSCFLLLLPIPLHLFHSSPCVISAANHSHHLQHLMLHHISALHSFFPPPVPMLYIQRCSWYFLFNLQNCEKDTIVLFLYMLLVKDIFFVLLIFHLVLYLLSYTYC